MFQLITSQWHFKNGEVCASLEWLCGSHVLLSFDDWSVSGTARRLHRIWREKSSAPHPVFLCACGDEGCDRLAFGHRWESDHVVFYQLERPGRRLPEEVAAPAAAFGFALAKLMEDLSDYEAILQDDEGYARRYGQITREYEKPLASPLAWDGATDMESACRLGTYEALVAHLRAFPWKIDDVILLLRHAQPSLRYLALRLLEPFYGQIEAQVVVPSLADSSLEVRAAAVRLLSRYGCFRRPSYRDLLYLRQKTPRVCRHVAAGSEGRLRLDDPVGLLVQLLEEATGEVRRAAANLLWELPLDRVKLHAPELRRLFDSRLSPEEKKAWVSRLAQLPAFWDDLESVALDVTQPAQVRKEALGVLTGRFPARAQRLRWLAEAELTAPVRSFSHRAAAAAGLLALLAVLGAVRGCR